MFSTYMVERCLPFHHCCTHNVNFILFIFFPFIHLFVSDFSTVFPSPISCSLSFSLSLVQCRSLSVSLIIESSRECHPFPFCRRFLHEHKHVYIYINYSRDRQHFIQYSLLLYFMPSFLVFYILVHASIRRMFDFYVISQGTSQDLKMKSRKTLAHTFT